MRTEADMADDRENSALIATRATAFLQKTNLVRTPENYAIAYEYASRRNPALNQRINDALSTNAALSPSLMEKLHVEFFNARPASAPRGLTERMEKIVERIIEAVEGTDESAASYSAALQKFSGNVSKASNPKAIRLLVEGIMKETQAMDGEVAQMRREVERATEEIQLLKDNLQSARRDAGVDALTGIANRRAFDTGLLEAMDQSRKDNTTVCLVLADLDHFKIFNDAHGHQAGDQVLKLVAQTIKQCVKGKDLAARYGGEEFAIVLPNTAITGAIALAETIRTTIASKRVMVKNSNEELGNITMSLGIAQCVPGDTMETLVGRADKALYGAKEQGSSARTGPRSFPRPSRGTGDPADGGGEARTTNRGNLLHIL